MVAEVKGACVHSGDRAPRASYKIAPPAREGDGWMDTPEKNRRETTAGANSKIPCAATFVRKPVIPLSSCRTGLPCRRAREERTPALCLYVQVATRLQFCHDGVNLEGAESGIARHGYRRSVLPRESLTPSVYAKRCARASRTAIIGVIAHPLVRLSKFDDSVVKSFADP